MRRRAWVGIGIGIGFAIALAALLLTPRASSPADEAVSALKLELAEDDSGWFIMRVNSKRTGTMHRTYMMKSGKHVADEQVQRRIVSSLEPLGWVCSEQGAGTEFEHVEWQKSEVSLWFSRDTTNPAQHWIVLERPQGAFERLKDQMIP